MSQYSCIWDSKNAGTSSPAFCTGKADKYILLDGDPVAFCWSCAEHFRQNKAQWHERVQEISSDEYEVALIMER